jgi:glycogen debranching enzyme
MTDIVRIRDKYYVRATSALADDRVRILKYGNTLAVLNRFGDIEAAGFGQLGLFHQETRHLSRWTVQLNGTQPLLLGSIIHDDNSFLSVDLTNFDTPLRPEGMLPRETVHLYRSKFVMEDTCYEEMRLSAYSTNAIHVTLLILFDADFADIFEIRGTKRTCRGQRLEDRAARDNVVLGYEGLDRIARRTILRFSPQPQSLTLRQARYELDLQPKRETFLFLSASCEQRESVSRVATYTHAYAQLLERAAQRKREACRVTTPNVAYQAWFSRSLDDLHLLTSGNSEGEYPYAGVPWFNTVFGRDGIITALETLWMSPAIAEAVLRHLAATQATKVDPERDAEPGKILHEMRRGEMANTREVPFGCYYGSVDSTPLYVVLAGAYLSRTGNLDFIRGVWPNVKAALGWMERYGDIDGDGFLEYRRRSSSGLVQQGWKDSSDSVFHSNGRLAEPPIALCEVQAYAYAAKREAAAIAQEVGEHDCADALARSAEALRIRFEEQFWDDELGTYAIALDGDKHKCRVRTSNAGQTLFCRIASSDRAARVREVLMGAPMYSGWGMRTLSAEEVRYNPMSYHNGSIWPHDNSLIALGLSFYGFQADAARILGCMREASGFMELRRMPELFCGFHKRDEGTGPTLYPVACAPQAWSAGAAFLLLRAALGITVRAEPPHVQFTNPQLPDGLDELRIENLRVGDAVAAIAVRRTAGGVDVECESAGGGPRLEVRCS